MIARQPSVRPGLTLFEVIISLVIFIVAVIPLWHLVNMGTERALDVQQQAQASLLCQRKLAEVIAGAESLGSTGLTSFKEDSAKDWQWRMDASEEITGLWKVRVTVQRDRADGSVFETSLSQMVLDPATRGSTLSANSSGSSDSSSSDGAASSSGNASGKNGGMAPAGGGAASKSSKGSPSGGGATTPSRGTPSIGASKTGGTGGGGGKTPAGGGAKGAISGGKGGKQ